MNKLGIDLRKILERLGLLPPAKLMYIGGSDVLPPPLKPAEEQALLARLAAGDETARQTLIERNLRLVVYIARRFENTGINIEDLISIGTIGLIKAIGTFRTDRNIKLATYSSRCIENEILMYIRKISGQKTEVSLDEPINTDWDGNELLLSDVLGTVVVRDRLPLGKAADHALARLGKADDGRRRSAALSVRDDDGLAALHDCDAGIGGAEINADDFGHIRKPPEKRSRAGQRAAAPARGAQFATMTFAWRMTSSSMVKPV